MRVKLYTLICNKTDAAGALSSVSIEKSLEAWNEFFKAIGIKKQKTIIALLYYANRRLRGQYLSCYKESCHYKLESTRSVEF